MKIGILDESVIKKIATDILVELPEVISVFVKGTKLIIESTDIDSVVKFLEKEHGLHLVVNGDNYMIASQMNEGLAQDVSNAGARAADIASSGLVSKTQEFMKKKRKEVGVPSTEAEKDTEAEKEARGVEEGGNAKDNVVDKFRGIKAMSKELNPEKMKQQVINSKELQLMIDRDPRFVQILRDIVSQADGDKEGSFKDKLRSMLELEEE